MIKKIAELLPLPVILSECLSCCPPVILSKAKNLTHSSQTLRFAQDDKGARMTDRQDTKERTTAAHYPPA